MNTSQYNPEIHHRRSIRLKGHNCAGGGLYFVTLCAHREFIAAAKGNPFGAGSTGATQVSPVLELIEERMRITAEKCPYMHWEEAVFSKLLEHKEPIIHCPAWRLGGVLSPEVLNALENNRMLILEMKNRDGMLDRLLRELDVKNKMMKKEPHADER